MVYWFIPIAIVGVLLIILLASLMIGVPNHERIGAMFRLRRIKAAQQQRDQDPNTDTSRVG